MSFGITAAGWLAIGAIAADVYTIASQKPLKLPDVPQPQAPPQSAAAQMPDAQDTVKSLNGTGQAGGAPGVAQTFLTGAGGVNQSSLTLGKTTLLGG